MKPDADTRSAASLPDDALSWKQRLGRLLCKVGWHRHRFYAHGELGMGPCLRGCGHAGL